MAVLVQLSTLLKLSFHTHSPDKGYVIKNFLMFNFINKHFIANSNILLTATNTNERTNTHNVSLYVTMVIEMGPWDE